MNYGHFRDDGREYVITDVATPSPWINYLENGRYFATISANGGGISYFKSPLHGRITRYRINDVPPDRPGKYIYVRDLDTGEIWSLTWQPVGRDRGAYRAAHGFGYTRVESQVEGIASSVLFFVPPDDDQEIWRARLTNASGSPRRLAVTGYVEFALGHALVDLVNQCDDQHFNRVRFERALNSLFATKTYWVTETQGTQHQENKEWDQWAFFTVNRPVTSYETLRERFLGPYRTESAPLGIEADSLSSRDTDFGNAVGALRVDLELAPGASEEVIFSLGVIPKAEFDKRKLRAVTKYHRPAASDTAFAALRARWDDIFRTAQVQTPDADIDNFLNHWIPYQARVAFDVGRVASFYYWGISRGFGFRDMAQDMIAIAPSDPDGARERVLLLARQMKSDGSVYHHFTSDGRGEFTDHCDDPLWFILAATVYIQETGDAGLLQKSVPFLDGPPGTILDHLLAVVNFARRRLGPHGLPIFGRGDWNDTLDYIGGREGGESVWGGMFYVAMYNRLIDLLESLKLREFLTDLADARDRMRAAIEDSCWDGAWYIRAFGENGRKIGSRKNAAGRIFINTQSWAVIAGLSDGARLKAAMDSVRSELGSAFGPKICAPAFREIDPKIGLITRCVRGKKENGAVFCHPIAWLIIAECLLGHGDAAVEYFRTLLPNRVDSETFVAEPYVYSQYITSDEHDGPGRASHSWQTGTAAWMYRAGLAYILGIRPTYEGLAIAPVIPAHWAGFKAERVFRGTRYYFEVANPDGVEAGIASVIVDGQPIKGDIIPFSKNPECWVSVTIRKP